MEAEEDIRTETNGILQDLLLALSKVRRPGPKGICVPQLGTAQSRELCCPVTDKGELQRDQGLHETLAFQEFS